LVTLCLLPHHPVYAYEFVGDRYDTGSLSGWIETMVALAINDPQIGPNLRERITDILAGTSASIEPRVDAQQGNAEKERKEVNRCKHTA